MRREGRGACHISLLLYLHAIYPNVVSSGSDNSLECLTKPPELQRNIYVYKYRALFIVHRAVGYALCIHYYALCTIHRALCTVHGFQKFEWEMHAVSGYGTGKTIA